LRILIDTQCWLWMAASPERLSPRSRALVEAVANDIMLSAASAWEIAIKYALDKLRLPEPPDRFVPKRMDTLRSVPLAIEHAHVLRVAVLPAHHRDPFDRILVAQAQLEHVPVLTADPIFRRYDVEVIDA
jgi:PIN domain nuclease of toxin-antitoxin system